MQFCRLWPAVGRGDSHQDIFRSVFGIFHKNVEISVVLERSCVEELILHFVLGATPVRLDQIGVGIGRLRVLVQILHVGVRRRRVEVEVVLLHILAVVALAVGQSEEPLFENRILAVP